MEFERFRQRILALLDRYGEETSINGNSLKCFFQPLDTGRMHVYLDDTEAQAVIRPGLFMIASGDAVIAINDTLTRNGRIYTVRKVAIERLGGTVMLTFAVLS